MLREGTGPMKKTYQRPTLNKAGALQVAAGTAISLN
jgi:hypothetical protein